MDKVAMLYDSSKCTACRGCQVACKQWNDLDASQTINTGSYENPPDLEHNTWTRISFLELEKGDALEWLFLKRGCMHCHEAACVEVCPTGALKHHPTLDIVTVERELCNGCGYCTQFCPFHVPRLDGSVLSGAAKSFKCNMCQERTTNSELPACVKTCPAGALSYGLHAEMVTKAQARVDFLQGHGYPKANLYGDNILGGLGRMYVLLEEPSVYGLSQTLTSPMLAKVWQEFVQPAAIVSFGASIVAVATAFFIARRHIRMEDVE